MTRLFFLDDDEIRVNAFRAAVEHDPGLTVAMSVAEGLLKFKPPYDAVFLDHDLGDFVYMSSTLADTGAEFLRQIDLSSLANSLVLVHSYNPDGARTMVAMLRDAGVHDAHYIPFGPSVLRIAKEVAGIELPPE